MFLRRAAPLALLLAALPTATALAQTDAGVTPPDVAAARTLFATTFAADCAEETDPGREREQEQFDFTYRDWSDDPAAPARLFRFLCSEGDYAQRHAYLLWTEYGGLKVLQFARPELKIEYEGDDEYTPLKSVTVTGFATTDILVDTRFDPASLRIAGGPCLSETCESSERAIYAFENEKFVLKTFDIDPVVDEKVNPYRIYDASQPVPLVPLTGAQLAEYPVHYE